MKLQASLVTCSAALAAAAPLAPRDSTSDNSANDMSDIISGSNSCAPVAVIFARGTFDSGNVGVWVGNQFADSLRTAIDGVAVQGVDPDAYPASLGDYLKEDGGSDAGATSMASAVEDYVSKCPSSTVILSGWSQGAIVAHKAINALSTATLAQVGGLVTFGDPNHVWNQLSVPSSVPTESYCITGTVLDPLCASLPSDFSLPSSISDLTSPFSQLPSEAVGEEEVEAAASVAVDLTEQIAENLATVTETLFSSHLVRLLLTPEHFMYGNNGMTETAAGWVADLTAVKTALQG